MFHHLQELVPVPCPTTTPTEITKRHVQYLPAAFNGSCNSGEACEKDVDQRPICEGGAISKSRQRVSGVGSIVLGPGCSATSEVVYLPNHSSEVAYVQKYPLQGNFTFKDPDDTLSRAHKRHEASYLFSTPGAAVPLSEVTQHRQARTVEQEQAALTSLPGFLSPLIYVACAWAALQVIVLLWDSLPLLDCDTVRLPGRTFTELSDISSID